VWRAALQELALVLTTENFNTWLAPTHVLAQDGDLLRVAVPCQFNKDWLEAKLHGRVMDALARVGREGVRVEYVVEASA
jgi:chromosomal replication initiation ATPase DnaA